MKSYLSIPLGLLAAATSGFAADPAWKIQEVYSSANGDVQFVKLVAASDEQNKLAGVTVRFVKGTTRLKTVTFPKNLPPATANRNLLIGTASLSTLYGVRPDVEIPAGFLARGADNFVEFADGKDRVSLADLPRDGVSSLNGVISNNDPTITKVQEEANPVNFGGASGVITGAPKLPNPILFVTQFPVPYDFTTIGSVFGNHLATLSSASRGGDLYIRYPNGVLKNLTAAAGFGEAGRQGAKSIAVREPCVHWNGKKAVFSMVIGAPKEQYEVNTYYWQMYEITGLGLNETPVITKVPNQPAKYNNVSPIYGTDDRIIFSSDLPHDQRAHLYPQLDEYEEAPTVSGLWSLNPVNGNLYQLDHSPSGSFTPTLDSYGRVIFTRWDHLQRDQQADADAETNTYGTFDYADESAKAAILKKKTELFPEPRGAREDLLAGTNLEGHTFNQFFPWQMHEDGTELETLNHIGRHELHEYFNRSLNDDPALSEFIPTSTAGNKNRVLNILQIKEDPNARGNYYGIDAPEFQTHAAGKIIRLNGAPNVNPDNMNVRYITSKESGTIVGEEETAPFRHSGQYRNPLPLTNGSLVAVHTGETRAETRDVERARPLSRYDFRLVTMRSAPGGFVADQPLTNGIKKAISYYDPDVLVKFEGTLWELDPVEVVARPRPTRRTSTLPPPETAVFAEEGVNEAALRKYLKANSLALIVSRDLTTRDAIDKQQPFNLRVAGTNTKTVGSTGKLYDISHLQIFQGDLLRGTGLVNPGDTPRPGRRVLARPMRGMQNPPDVDGFPGSVKLGTDGSMAAFVPARRALSWQLTAEDGTPVVRERYWLTFQSGEIRTCTSCHGINTRDQASQPIPVNKPEALRKLLRYWKKELAH